MKIILLENIDRLGKIGDIVTVKDGYARNYLFAKKCAKEATPGNMKMLDALKKKQALEEEKKLKSLREIADKIEGMSITISAEAGEEEKLFGSVTADMISEALADAGIIVHKKEIAMDEPIKKLGVYSLVARLHPEVKATVKVWVVKK